MRQKGEQKEEALANVQGAIRENLEAIQRAGYPVPEQTVSIEYVELRNPIY